MLDEATQVETADWALVEQAARQSGARVVAVGDVRQMGAVGAGGMFREVTEHVPSVELEEVMRFRQEWEAAASLGFRDGDFAAYAKYDARGRMRAGTREVAMQEAAEM